MANFQHFPLSYLLFSYTDKNDFELPVKFDRAELWNNVRTVKNDKRWKRAKKNIKMKAKKK